MMRISCLPALLALSLACAGDPTDPQAAGDTVLVVLPRALDLPLAGTGSLTALLVLDAVDTVAVNPAWTSRDQAIATVSVAGVVTGLAEGSTRVLAEAYGLRDSVTVAVADTVLPPPGLQPLGSDSAVAAGLPHGRSR